MFTGLVETVGEVRSTRSRASGLRLAVATRLAGELSVGESIAVDGACLTVAAAGGKSFEADVSPETLAFTTLADVRRGARVNLERAVRADQRLGGHMVSGHVDGTGRVTRRRMHGDYLELEIAPAQQLPGAVVLKGSVAVDGVSLTVSSVGESSFSVSIIPQTLSATTLGESEPGAVVNIETDMIGKYVEHYTARENAPDTPRPALQQFLGGELSEGG